MRPARHARGAPVPVAAKRVRDPSIPAPSVRSAPAFRSSPAADDVAAALLKLLFHPAGLNALELRVWTILRAEPGLGVCALASGSGHHRKSVSRAMNRLIDQGLARDVSPTSDRRDPSTGQLTPARYVALDPSPTAVTVG